jgi:hypothetical protein
MLHRVGGQFMRRECQDLNPVIAEGKSWDLITQHPSAGQSGTGRVQIFARLCRLIDEGQPPWDTRLVPSLQKKSVFDLVGQCPVKA